MKRYHKVLLLCGGIFILLVLLSPQIYARGSSAYLLLSIAHVKSINIPATPYALTAAATTTMLHMDNITLSVPWTDLLKERINPGISQWVFPKNEGTLSVMTMSAARTGIIGTTTDAVTMATLGRAFPGIATSTNEAFEQRIWRIQRSDVAIFGSKEQLLRIPLLVAKANFYDCQSLNEFLNQNGVRGLICVLPQKEGNTMVTFFTPSDEKYLLLLKINSIKDRDSIIASLAFKATSTLPLK